MEPEKNNNQIVSDILGLGKIRDEKTPYFYIKTVADFETTTEQIVQAIAAENQTPPDVSVVLGCSVVFNGLDMTKLIEDYEPLRQSKHINQTTSIASWWTGLLEQAEHFTRLHYQEQNKKFTDQTQLNVNLFFHNLKFDGNFLLKFLNNQLKLRPKNGFKSPREVGFEVFGTRSKYYKIHIQIFYKKHPVTILVKDSLKLLSTSVKKLGETSVTTQGKFIKNERGEEIVPSYHIYPVPELADLMTDNGFKLVVEEDFKTKQIEKIYKSKLDKNEGRAFIDYNIRDCLIVGEALFKDLAEALSDLDQTRFYVENHFNKMTQAMQKFNKNERTYKTVQDYVDGVLWERTTIGSLVFNNVEKIASYYFINKNNQANKFMINKHGLDVDTQQEVYFKNRSDVLTNVNFNTFKTLHPFYKGALSQFSNKYNELFYVPNLDIKNYKSGGIDVNSAYPHWMTKALPFDAVAVGTDGRPPQHYLRWWEQYKNAGAQLYKLLEIRVKKFKVKPEWATFPFIINESDEAGRYITEFNGEMLSYKWEDELNAYIKRCEYFEYEINNVYWCKGLPWLSECIDTLYNKRRLYKSQGKQGLQQSIKIMINSMYGVNGMKPVRPFVVRVADTDLETLINAGCVEVVRYNKQKSKELNEDTYDYIKTLTPDNNGMLFVNFKKTWDIDFIYNKYQEFYEYTDNNGMHWFNFCGIMFNINEVTYVIDRLPYLNKNIETELNDWTKINKSVLNYLDDENRSWLFKQDLTEIIKQFEEKLETKGTLLKIKLTQKIKDEEITKIYYIKNIIKELQINGLNDGYVTSLTMEEDENTINPNKHCRNVLLASFITMRQRVYQLDTIDKIGVENSWYTDTDSVYFVNVPMEKWKRLEAELCDPSELGKWKDEHPDTHTILNYSSKSKTHFELWGSAEAVELINNHLKQLGLNSFPFEKNRMKLKTLIAIKNYVTNEISKEEKFKTEDFNKWKIKNVNYTVTFSGFNYKNYYKNAEECFWAVLDTVLKIINPDINNKTTQVENIREVDELLNELIANYRPDEDYDPELTVEKTRFTYKEYNSGCSLIWGCRKSLKMKGSN